MKMKKLLAGLLACMMMLTLLAGCGNTSSGAGNGGSGAAASGEPGDTPCTIRISWWGGDSRHSATQAAIDAFMKKYPNITVESEFGAWTNWEEKAATQLMSGTAPDLMQINWNWINAYSIDGTTFSDLNQYSDIIDLTQWEQAQLDQCTVDASNLQAVPIAMTGRIFYWNQSTFDKAGLATPTTFDELMAAGPIFKEKLGDGFYPLAMMEYDRIFFLVDYLESKYGKDWVTDGQLNYTTEQIQEGLDLLKKMEDAHVIPTIKKLAGDGADSLDKNQNWIDGNYAGILEWDSSADKFVGAAASSTIVVGDYFTDWGEYQGGFTKVSMGFAIPSNSAHPREAALLMNYLLNDPEGTALMGIERGIPASKAALQVCQDNGLLDSLVAEANAKVMAWCQFNLDPTFEDSALKNNPEGLYYKVMSKVSYGEIDTATGAQQLVDGINTVLAQS